MKVSEYMWRWLEERRPDLERSTYEAMTVYLGSHICPWFDDHGVALEDLRPLDIKNFATYQRAHGRQDGRGSELSPDTIRKYLHILRQAFNDAVLYELLPTNPADPVKLPRKRSISRAAQFIPVEDARAILAAFKGHTLYPVVYLALIYGLRRSEVLGLQWGAIDFRLHTLTIRHTVVKGLTIETKDRTKTESSRRIYPLLPEVEQLLAPLRKGAPDTAYVIARSDGSPLRPDSVTRGFQRVLTRNQLPPMRFHDLRHATASILFDRGWSVPDVQHWLGHSDIETTMNIYVAYNNNRKIRIGGDLTGLFSER